MKVKAEFIKEEMTVGLSTEVPIAYEGPEQKYALADRLSPIVQYSRESSRFEFDITTADVIMMSGEAERLECHVLVNELPAAALSEAVSDLRDLHSHYIQIEERRRNALPPARPKLVAATVEDKTTT